MADGYVKVSAKAVWDDGKHPESLDQNPTLELKIELTSYTSRKAMADMLRNLASWVDEGMLHPFNPPLADRTITGKWDEESKRWIIEEGNRQ